MNQSESAKFAKVLLSAVGMREGECLYIKAEPVHWAFLNVLAAEAYRRGARYVEVDAAHPGLLKARADHSREADLSFVPGYRAKIHEHHINEGWNRIVISGQEDPDLLTTIDPARFGRLQKALSIADAPLRRALQADKFHWLVTVLPTPGWAVRVLGEGVGADAADQLWDVLVPILKLDRPDPVRAWKEHGTALAARQKTLADLDLDAVKFTGPGTELIVGLPRGAVWLGGGAHGPDGRWFLPNLPTEEVFTTPDFRRASGTASMTRPAIVQGRVVRDARFTFDEGRVVEWESDDNRDALTELFATDDQARHLGELALVDASSSIYASGLTFHNTLLDENAACHIAFGSSYPGGIPGGDSMTSDEYREAGGNVSAIHNDMMIGSPSVDVTGIPRDGGSVPLIRDGRWVI